MIRHHNTCKPYFNFFFHKYSFLTNFSWRSLSDEVLNGAPSVNITSYECRVYCHVKGGKIALK